MPTFQTDPAPPPCALAGALAERLRAARDELTHRWLERILARVTLHPNRVFPSEDLIDHVPLLIDGIADYLEDPAAEVTAAMPLVDKARELGELRYHQGFDVHQILKEHELLKGILFTFLTRAVDEIDEPCERGELMTCAHRVTRAVEVITQATTTNFLALLDARVREREERLRGFNRMVSHELKNRVGAIGNARIMLAEPWIEGEDRARFELMVDENVRAIRQVLDNLQALTRLEHERETGTDDRRQHRNVRLPQAARDVVRQLREMARAHRVVVRVAEDLPDVEVNAAAVELCLTNYVSNAIKYADPSAAVRWAEIHARLAPAALPTGGVASELVVEVRDNGLGVPAAARARLFERFYRAHEHDGTAAMIEGTGLGLSIVRETVASLGGRAWATFPVEGGAVFAFALPYRRTADREAATEPAAADHS